MSCKYLAGLETQGKHKHSITPVNVRLFPQLTLSAKPCFKHSIRQYCLQTVSMQTLNSLGQEFLSTHINQCQGVLHEIFLMFLWGNHSFLFLGIETLSHHRHKHQAHFYKVFNQTWAGKEYFSSQNFNKIQNFFPSNTCLQEIFLLCLMANEI